jgi:CelD/BcsL family acetyltransferase involved in cellulose biosynthesis
LEVNIHKDINVLDDWLQNVGKLKNNFHEITVFQDLDWIKHWWEHKSKKNRITPYIIEIKDEDKPIGLIPLYCSKVKIAKLHFYVLRPMGSELSDYLIPILSKHHSYEHLINLAMEKISQDHIHWDCIEWDDVPEDSLFANFLKEHQYNNLLLDSQESIICPYLLLGKNFKETKHKFDKKLVKELEKKGRKLRSTGDLQFEKVSLEHEIEPVMERFFELHCERWSNTDTLSKFRFKEERDYTLRVAKSLFKNNLLHLTYLRSGDHIVAVEFSMSDEKKIYLYLTAYDPKHRKYSVGNILLYHLILDACKEGYEIVDFTRGDENYKQSWGTRNKFNTKYIFFNRSFKSIFFKKIYRNYYSKKFNEKLDGKIVFLIRIAALLIMFNERFVPFIKELINFKPR